MATMNNTLIPLHPHTNIFCIEVPEDATEICITCYDDIYYLDWKSDGISWTKTLLGDMQLLGTVKNKVIDFDCEAIYKESIEVYKWDKTQFNAKSCFLSLMESNNLDLTKDYVILKKI